jgi:hypothetical protein
MNNGNITSRPLVLLIADSQRVVAAYSILRLGGILLTIFASIGLALAVKNGDAV